MEFGFCATPIIFNTLHPIELRYTELILLYYNSLMYLPYCTAAPANTGAT